MESWMQAFAPAARRFALTVAITGLSMGLFALSTTSVEAQTRLPIVSGLTFGEWSGRWWQWAFANGLPTSDGAFGTGTVDCRAGQGGAVWFLAGTTPPGTPVERNCAIASGKLLFFPLVNYAEFNPDPICPSNNTCTLPEKRAISSGVLDGGQPGADFNGDGKLDELDRSYACRLSAEVDGIQTIFADHPIVRTQSPTFPLQGDPLAVSDGYWIMLPPLPKGDHQIRFTGAFCGLSKSPTEVPFFSVDVTYNVSVS